MVARIRTADIEQFIDTDPVVANTAASSNPRDMVSYLRLDGSIYTLNKVNTDPVSFLNELREFYKVEYEKRVNELTTAEVLSLESEWNRMQNKINERTQRGVLKIPAELTPAGSVCGVVNGEVCPLHIFDYMPIFVKCNKGYLESKELYIDFAKFKCATVANAGKKLLIRLKPRSLGIMVWAYSAKSQRIYAINCATFHTLGGLPLPGSFNYQCTGNASSAEFWRLRNDPTVTNSINLFSLANRTAVSYLRKSSFSLETVINNDNIEYIKVDESPTAEEGGAQWRI